MNKRFWMHFPLGLLAAFFLVVIPATGIIFAASFLAYEIIQDWRKHDSSYKDVIGYLVGMAVGGGIASIIVLVQRMEVI